MTIIRKLCIPLSILLNTLLIIKIRKQQKDFSLCNTIHLNSAFSETDPPPKHMLEQSINQAKRTLDIAIYNFNEPTIAETLIQAKHQGVYIRILIDAKKAKQPNVKQIISQLTNNGVSVRVHTSEKMHLKMTIIDQTTLITGSFNYTDASADENIEQLFTISNQREARKWSAIFDTLWQNSLREF